MWEYDWGDKLDFLYDVWDKTKEEPRTLQNRPDVPYELLEFYRAFLTLATRRQRSGMGEINPIPFTDILAYIELFGTSDEEMFVSHVIAMDLALIRHISERKTSQGTDHGRQSSKS